MDEPLSNLDAKLRVAMRSEIVRIHKEVGATTIYVTHDQIEAMTMASRIVVMRDGYIQQIGEPNDVYQHPVNMFVAGFIGTPAMNFLHGKLENGYFLIDGCDQKIALTNGQKELLKEYEGKRLVYGIRPENLIYEGSDRFKQHELSAFAVKCGIVEKLGDIINVHAAAGDSDVVVKMSGKYNVDGKDTIRVAAEEADARFFNESTTMAITPGNNAYSEAKAPELTQLPEPVQAAKTPLSGVSDKIKSLFRNK